MSVASILRNACRDVRAPLGDSLDDGLVVLHVYSWVWAELVVVLAGVVATRVVGNYDDLVVPWVESGLGGRVDALVEYDSGGSWASASDMNALGELRGWVLGLGSDRP